MEITKISKEGFDPWDKTHPFWNYSKFAHHPDKAMCPFIVSGLPEFESNILLYIWHKLNENQDYDAGNAILTATQKKLISLESTIKIADYFVSEKIKFSSKVGKILFVRITRSLGLLSFSCENKDIGLTLWLSGIESTKKMKYQKNAAIEQWCFYAKELDLPSELKDALTNSGIIQGLD